MRYLIALLIGFGLGYLAAKGPPNGATTGPLNLSATPAAATPHWLHDPDRKTKLDATPVPPLWRNLGRIR